jgi:hypothetical protein
MDIREGFLHNTEKGSFYVSAKLAKVWRHIKIHLHPAALRKPVHIRSTMTHIAFQEQLEGTAVNWLEKVTGEQYRLMK